MSRSRPRPIVLGIRWVCDEHLSGPAWKLPPQRAYEAILPSDNPPLIPMWGWCVHCDGLRRAEWRELVEVPDAR